jgi:hypothetical protein
MDNLVWGRVVAVFLAILLWGMFSLYFKAISRFEPGTARRTVSGSLCILISLGIIFLQLDRYSSITEIGRPLDDDLFFFWLVILEAVNSTVALFTFLIKDRNRKIRERP